MVDEIDERREKPERIPSTKQFPRDRLLRQRTNDSDDDDQKSIREKIIQVETTQNVDASASCCVFLLPL